MVEKHSAAENTMTSIVLVDRIGFTPSQPLWQRVPVRDADGGSLADFIMLIPRLGSWPEDRRQQMYLELESVFEGFGERVVFADLNLKLSLLWVSMRPAPGGCLPLVAAVRQRIPEAVLVASQAEAMAGMAARERRCRRYPKLLR